MIPFESVGLAVGVPLLIALWVLMAAYAVLWAFHIASWVVDAIRRR